MRNGFAIAIAWPETKCKQAGAWYDPAMRWIGFNREGYYKVGHAAIVLVDVNDQRAHYYDFGRYHAPSGFGRVRSAETDHDLRLNTRPYFTDDRKELMNAREILTELYMNPSCHGDGEIIGKVIPIQFSEAMQEVIKMQRSGYIPYGPFVQDGTNCSRFVNAVLKAGGPDFVTSLKLSFPPTISPSPMTNLLALPGERIRVNVPENSLIHHFAL